MFFFLATYMEVLFESGFEWVRNVMELNKLFNTQKMRMIARRARIQAGYHGRHLAKDRGVHQGCTCRVTGYGFWFFL
jgi:hypothetical protein